MIPNSRVLAGIATVACFGLSSISLAQPAADSTRSTPIPAVATMLQGGVMGELQSVSIPRSEETLRNLIEEARSLERTSKAEIERGKFLETEAEGRAKIMGQEIETTRTRREAAKQVKDKAAVTELDARLKKQTREYKYLQQLLDAVRADGNRLESARAAAEASRKALEIELDLTRKQAELGPEPAPAAVEQYRKMLRGMLEAQRLAADRGREASDQRKNLVEMKLKQLDALSKLSP